MRDPMRMLLLASACAAISAVSLSVVLSSGVMQAVPLVDWPSVKTPRTIAPSAMPEILAGRGAAFGPSRTAGVSHAGQALPLASSPHSPGVVLDELGDGGTRGSAPAPATPAIPPVRQTQLPSPQEQPQARPVGGLSDISLAPHPQPSPAGAGSPLVPPWAQPQPAGSAKSPSEVAATGGTPIGGRDQATPSVQSIPISGAATPPSAQTDLQKPQASLRSDNPPRRTPPPTGQSAESGMPAPPSTGEKSGPAHTLAPPGGAPASADRPSLATLTTAVVGAGGASSIRPPQAGGTTPTSPPSAEVAGASPGATPRPPRKPSRDTAATEHPQPKASVAAAARPAAAPSREDAAIGPAEGEQSAPRKSSSVGSTSTKARQETVAQAGAAAARSGPAQRGSAPGPSYTIPFSDGSASVSRLGVAIIEQAAQAGSTAVLRSSGRPIDRNRLEAVRMEFLMLGVHVVSAEPDARVTSGEVRIEIK